jgi:hypothetical protein
VIQAAAAQRAIDEDGFHSTVHVMREVRGIFMPCAISANGFLKTWQDMAASG